MFHVTERLLLRPAWPEDAEALTQGIADRGVVRNLATAPWPYSLDDARKFIAMGQDTKVPGFLLTLPGAHGSQIIGGAGLGRCEDGVEIGYWIARPYWGRGFATEASRGVIEVARSLGYRTLSGGHFADNPASGKVLRKLGFVPTGRTAMRHSCARGEETECVMYTMDLEAGEGPTRQAA